MKHLPPAENGKRKNTLNRIPEIGKRDKQKINLPQDLMILEEQMKNQMKNWGD
jgi:hypothetical protein